LFALKYSEGPTSLNQKMAFVKGKLDRKVKLWFRKAACLAKELLMIGGVGSFGGLSIGSPVSVNQMGFFVRFSYSFMRPPQIC